MAWFKTKPAGTDSLKTSDDMIRANWAAIEATLPSVASGTAHPMGADGTAGRILRSIQLKVENGTDDNTLKCTVTNVWNGDTIAITDNIAKDATTGHFTLSADGKELEIEAAGFTGNCVSVLAGNMQYNRTTVNLGLMLSASVNNILVQVVEWAIAGATLDMTVLVDTGIFQMSLVYITDA